MRRLLVVCFTAPFLGAVEPSFYLPDDARPVRYKLDLRIDPAQDGFSGRASIEIEVAKASETLWLNGTGLTVTRATLDNSPVRIEAVKEQFLAVRGDSTITPGHHELSVEYSAKFTARAVGAYRRKSGAEWYVYTTFTPIDARRAFPCFDEPRFKTPWELSIAAPDDTIALANSRQLSESRDSDGLRRFHFAPTLPLPSEVVAFAVGPFDVVDGGVAGRNRIPVRVITPRGRAAEGRPPPSRRRRFYRDWKVIRAFRTPGTSWTTSRSWKAHSARWRIPGSSHIKPVYCCSIRRKLRSSPDGYAPHDGS